MAAVSMIVGETDDLQLGFPSAYQSNYAAKSKPLRAFPSVIATATPETFMAGDDLQAQWHAQKKRDADYMSGAKVQSTINSNMRANSSAHGYYGMPKPVLGQRVFANPSNEALILESARRDHTSAPFHFSDAHNCYQSVYSGGVLRSAAGQTYGKSQLMKRVSQLNDINDAKVQFQLGQSLIPGMSQEPIPFIETFNNSAANIGESITRNLGLTRVLDLLQGQDVLNTQESGFRSPDEIFKETRNVLGSVLALGSTATVSEMSDTLGAVQEIGRLLRAAVDTGNDDPYMDEYANKQAKATYITLQDIYTKLEDYLKQMVAAANLQPKERETLARSLTKSLGFSKAMNVAVGRSREALSLAGRTGTVDSRAEAINAASNGRFDRDRGDRREDSEHGTRNPFYSSDEEDFRDEGDANRQEFGRNSGRYSDEQTTAFYNQRQEGESASEEEEGERALPSRSRQKPQRQPQEGSAVSGFFDPDTQAFNVSAARASSAQAPPPGVLGLLKGRIASRKAQSSGNPRAPAAAASLPPLTDRAVLPNKFSEFRALAQRYKEVYPSVTVPRGSAYGDDESSWQYKAYIGNLHRKLIRQTQGSNEA